MSSTDKGGKWRLMVRRYLEAQGFTVTQRPHFQPGDDLTATLPGMALSVECKNYRAARLAEFVDQAERQAGPGQIPVLFSHRVGRASVDDGYVILTGRAFRQLIA